MKPFVLIVGPTASGKSALGLRLAQAFDGAILNCDSLQTYRRLDIGTAKPSVEERRQVPHHLFDILGPGEVLTAGDFRREALAALERELPRAPVFGVGGSGFYIQALEKGMFDVEKPSPASEEKVRQQVAEHGLPFAYGELERLDPECAAELNPQDAYRITRALIIIEDSGKKVSDLRRSFKPKPFPFPLLKLGLAPSRDFLLPRVRARTERMLAAGLLEEARQLVSEGWGDWPPLQSVGYRECLQCLRGEILPERLAAQICEKTLQLSKKQRTWFKREQNIHWLDVEDPFPEARQLVENFLAAR